MCVCYVRMYGMYVRSVRSAGYVCLLRMCVSTNGMYVCMCVRNACTVCMQGMLCTLCVFCMYVTYALYVCYSRVYVSYVCVYAMYVCRLCYACM